MEGQVFTSNAGDLLCKKIIHAVGPRWRNGFSREESTLSTCVNNCFSEAERYGLQSLAIPPISTGIFRFPLDKAVEAIVGVVAEREAQNSFLPKHVLFVDNKDDSLAMFEKELRAKFDTATVDPPLLQATPSSDTGDLLITAMLLCTALVILNIQCV